MLKRFLYNFSSVLCPYSIMKIKMKFQCFSLLFKFHANEDKCNGKLINIPTQNVMIHTFNTNLYALWEHLYHQGPGITMPP